MRVSASRSARLGAAAFFLGRWAEGAGGLLDLALAACAAVLGLGFGAAGWRDAAFGPRRLTVRADGYVQIETQRGTELHRAAEFTLARRAPPLSTEDGAHVLHLTLGERSLEIGRSASADIVVSELKRLNPELTIHGYSDRVDSFVQRRPYRSALPEDARRLEGAMLWPGRE